LLFRLIDLIVAEFREQTSLANGSPHVDIARVRPLSDPAAGVEQPRPMRQLRPQKIPPLISPWEEKRSVISSLWTSQFALQCRNAMARLKILFVMLSVVWSRNF